MKPYKSKFSEEETQNSNTEMLNSYIKRWESKHWEINDCYVKYNHSIYLIKDGEPILVPNVKSGTKLPYYPSIDDWSENGAGYEKI